MTKTASSFARNKGRFKPEPKVLVVCEDKRSSKVYFEDASSHFRVNYDVKITHCGNTDPKGIVEYAIDKAPNYDEIFCVIDRDTHLNFDEALLLARRNKKITLIKSYPCFEFWLILHFGYCTKPFQGAGSKSAGDRAVEFLREKPSMQDYAKGADGIFSLLGEEKLSLARNHSPKILARAIEEKALNPSTEVHILIEKMESMSEPQPAKK